MGKLRHAMQRDMELKNFSPKTMRCYLYWMSRYALHYRKPPDELADSEIKAFLHFLRKEKKAAQSSMNQAYSALKFFYEATLGRPWNGAQIPRCKRGRRLPVLLSREEVPSILSATENLKHVTILATIHSGGLRLSEAAELKLSDVDSRRSSQLMRARNSISTMFRQTDSWFLKEMVIGVITVKSNSPDLRPLLIISNLFPEGATIPSII